MRNWSGLTVLLVSRGREKGLSARLPAYLNRVFIRSMKADLSDNHLPDAGAPFNCPKGDFPCSYLAEIVSLREQVLRLTEQVRIDALTGLYNFRFFTEALPMEMERTRRSAQALSLIILDVDHFKIFNDRWGHEQGNKALVHIAQLIGLAVRKLDMACRFGGEEFVIILPNTDLHQAVQVAGRLREMVESTSFYLESQKPVTITASLGVDTFKAQDIDTADNLLNRVDSWLYKAKQDGRNCVAHPPLVTSQLNRAVTQEEKDALLILPKDSFPQV